MDDETKKHPVCDSAATTPSAVVLAAQEVVDHDWEQVVTEGPTADALDAIGALETALNDCPDPDIRMGICTECDESIGPDGVMLCGEHAASISEPRDDLEATPAELDGLRSDLATVNARAAAAERAADSRIEELETVLRGREAALVEIAGSVGAHNQSPEHISVVARNRIAGLEQVVRKLRNIERDRMEEVERLEQQIREYAEREDERSDGTPVPAPDLGEVTRMARRNDARIDEILARFDAVARTATMAENDFGRPVVLAFRVLAGK